MCGAADGGAVSRGRDVASAAATQCAAGPASRPCSRCGEGGPKGSAEATPQEGPPPAAWQLRQRQDSAAALRGRASHRAAWVTGMTPLIMASACSR